MNDDPVDLGPLDPRADPAHFERTVRRITQRAAGELALRRARFGVVGQIQRWKRPMLAAAMVTAVFSGGVLWHTPGGAAPVEDAVGIVEALGVPTQVAQWMRADTIPTPAQLLTALGAGE